MKYVVYGSFVVVIGFIISLVTQGGRDAWSDLIHNSLIEIRLNRKLPKEERKSPENRKEMFLSFLPSIIR